MNLNEVFGGDVVHHKAKENGYKYISDGRFCKTLKESNEIYKEFIKNEYRRKYCYRRFRIHDSYDFLFRKTKDHLKSIIIYSIPCYNGSLCRCSKSDLVGIIKKEKLIQIN